MIGRINTNKVRKLQLRRADTYAFATIFAVFVL